MNNVGPGATPFKRAETPILYKRDTDIKLSLLLNDGLFSKTTLVSEKSTKISIKIRNILKKRKHFV